MKVSCGFILICDDKWLICHPTRNKFWDLPKGKREETETDLIAAKRELYEETGIVLSEADLMSAKDLGCAKYNKEKHLHLFQIEKKIDVETLKCVAMVNKNNKTYPEMDAFKLLPPKEAFEKLSPVMQRWMTKNIKEKIIWN